MSERIKLNTACNFIYSKLNGGKQQKKNKKKMENVEMHFHFHFHLSVKLFFFVVF